MTQPRAWKRTWVRRAGDLPQQDAEGKVGLIIVWRVLGVGSWSQFGKWLLWLLAALGLIETVQ